MNKFKNPILVNSISILIFLLLIVYSMTGEITTILDFANIYTVETFVGCMFYGASSDYVVQGVFVLSIFLVFLLRRLHKLKISNPI